MEKPCPSEKIEDLTRDLVSMTNQLELLARRLEMLKEENNLRNSMHRSTVEVDGEPIEDEPKEFNPEAGP